MTPAPIVFWFNPNTKTRTPPGIELAEAPLPADVAVEPVETFAKENVEERARSNCSVLIAAAPGMSVIGMTTPLPALPAADPTARVAVCPIA